MRLAVTTAAWLGALALAGVAAAAGIGANDDTGKFAPDGGARFFAQMADLGLRQSVMTVRFLPSDPTALPDGEALDQAIPVAQLAGLRVTLAVYPYPPRQLAGRKGTAGPVRRLAPAARRALPEGEAVRRHERAEPARVSAAPVRRPPAERLGGRAGGSSRRGTTRSRPSTRRSGDRARTLAAGERPPDGPEQRLHVAGPVPRGARRRGTGRAAAPGR